MTLTLHTFVALETLTAAQLNAMQSNANASFPGTTAGDTDYYTSGTNKGRVAIGANGSYYSSNGSVPGWTKFYRAVSILLNTNVSLVVGDDAFRWRVPAIMNGWDLQFVSMSRVSGSGSTLTVQLRRIRSGVNADMLSTKLTLASTKNDTTDSGVTPAVIDTTKDDITTADQIAVDIDDPGTASLYVVIEMIFAKP